MAASISRWSRFEHSLVTCFGRTSTRLVTLFRPPLSDWEQSPVRSSPILDRLGVSNSGGTGGITDTVRFSFWFGGAALFLAVLWTVFTTREYAPEEMEQFGEGSKEDEGEGAGSLASRGFRSAIIWMISGAIVIVAVLGLRLEKEVYLLGALLIAYGLANAAAIISARSGRSANMLTSIVGDFSAMPTIMKRLALVQFFSWSALFIMWINTTPVVAQNFYRSPDPASSGYQDAGNWVGVLFAIYNGVAALAAILLLPMLARHVGKAKTHMMCLICGALGYASFLIIKDSKFLVISEIGIGIAWASILAMPYAILASSLPQRKLGIYMGLFNIFIVVPQLLVATIMGSIMKSFSPISRFGPCLLRHW